MKQNSSHMVSDGITLGTVIRAARVADDISLRELARRAGLSAAQLSRLENGRTLRPDDRTLDRIASGLGRPSSVVWYMAGRCNFEESALAEQVEQAWAWEGYPLWRDLTDERRTVVRDWFVRSSLAESISSWSDFEESELLWQLGRAWPGLTPARRKRLVEFTEDQLALSMQERRDEKREQA